MNQNALREDDAPGGGREDDEEVKEAWRDGERKEGRERDIARMREVKLHSVGTLTDRGEKAKVEK